MLHSGISRKPIHSTVVSRMVLSLARPFNNFLQITMMVKIISILKNMTTRYPAGEPYNSCCDFFDKIIRKITLIYPIT